MMLTALAFALTVSTQEDVWGTDFSKPLRPQGANTLSVTEEREGFELLFDGRTAKFRGYKRGALPTAWKAGGGEFRIEPGTGTGGDVVSLDQYGDFDLRLEWKVAPGGNSGIFFRVTEDQRVGYFTGPEMQVLDDEKHPDGKNPLTSAGSNYGLYAPAKKVVKGAGEWNAVRIVVIKDHVRFWLNGTQIVEYTLGSPEWKAKVAASKFNQWPTYGTRKKGHIALQDHGDKVAFRNIRIKRLD